MNIEALRKLADREEIDYQFLLSALSGYACPRDKITTWLQSGTLIRVKKGLYVFSKKIAQRPYSTEVLANLIYGPSAISLHYALSFYGLIPERSVTITSITNKRNKAFTTPVGNFSYRYLNSQKYPIGIELLNHFLIASPEKALCDHIYLTDKKIKIKNLEEIEAYLLYDMRLDETLLKKMRKNLLTQISDTYQDIRLTLLAQLLSKWKKL